MSKKVDWGTHYPNRVEDSTTFSIPITSLTPLNQFLQITPGGIVSTPVVSSLVAGTGISLSGATGAVTITNTGAGVGTVTSVTNDPAAVDNQVTGVFTTAPIIRGLNPGPGISISPLTLPGNNTIANTGIISVANDAGAANGHIWESTAGGVATLKTLTAAGSVMITETANTITVTGTGVGGGTVTSVNNPIVAPSFPQVVAPFTTTPTILGLAAGTGISIAQDASDSTITNAGILALANDGIVPGDGHIWESTLAGTATLKTLTAGAAISITETVHSITISATGIGTGTVTSVNNPLVAPPFPQVIAPFTTTPTVLGLAAGTGISIAQNASDSTITNTGVISIANDGIVPGNAQILETPVVGGAAVLKTLTAGASISLTNGADSITISATGIGTGTVTSVNNPVVAPPFPQVIAPFTTTPTVLGLAAGTGISIAQNASNSTITNTGIISLANDGGAAQGHILETPVVGGAAVLKTLTAGGTLTITENANTITLTGAAGGTGTVTNIANSLYGGGPSFGLVQNSPITAAGNLYNLVAGSNMTITQTGAAPNGIITLSTNPGTLGQIPISQSVFFDAINGGLGQFGHLEKPYNAANLASIAAAGGAGVNALARVVVHPTPLVDAQTFSWGNNITFSGEDRASCYIMSIGTSSTANNCYVENVTIGSTVLNSNGMVGGFTNCTFLGNVTLNGSGTFNVFFRNCIFNSCYLFLGNSASSLMNIEVENCEFQLVDGDQEYAVGVHSNGVLSNLLTFKNNVITYSFAAPTTLPIYAVYASTGGWMTNTFNNSFICNINNSLGGGFSGFAWFGYSGVPDGNPYAAISTNDTVEWTNPLQGGVGIFSLVDGVSGASPGQPIIFINFSTVVQAGNFLHYLIQPSGQTFDVILRGSCSLGGYGGVGSSGIIVPSTLTNYSFSDTNNNKVVSGNLSGGTFVYTPVGLLSIVSTNVLYSNYIFTGSGLSTFDFGSPPANFLGMSFHVKTGHIASITITSTGGGTVYGQNTLVPDRGVYIVCDGTNYYSS